MREFCKILISIKYCINKNLAYRTPLLPHKRKWWNESDRATTGRRWKAPSVSSRSLAGFLKYFQHSGLPWQLFCHLGWSVADPLVHILEPSRPSRGCTCESQPGIQDKYSWENILKSSCPSRGWMDLWHDFNCQWHIELGMLYYLVLYQIPHWELESNAWAKKSCPTSP